MPLENASTIAELDPANPTGSDSIGDGDNHIRMIKQVLQNEESAHPNAEESVDAMRENVSLQTGAKVSVKRYYAERDGGASTYLIKTQAVANTDGDVFSATSMVNILLDNGKVAVLQTGAQFTTLQCGAVGDGVSDDSAPIQEGVDVAILRGARLFISPNIEAYYSLGTELVIAGSCQLEGSGLLRTTDIEQNAIKVVGDYVTLIDLNIKALGKQWNDFERYDGNCVCAVGTENGTHIKGLKVIGGRFEDGHNNIVMAFSDNFYISDGMHVNNNPGTGGLGQISGYDCHSGSVVNNTGYGNSSMANHCYLLGRSSDCYVAGNHAYGFNYEAFMMNLEKSRIIGNFVDSTETNTSDTMGIECRSGGAEPYEGNVISNNQVRGCRFGIVVSDRQVAGGGMPNTIVSGNSIEDADVAGILIQGAGSVHCTVGGNVVNGVTGSSTDNIGIHIQAPFTTVVGNTVKNCDGIGLRGAGSATDCVFSANSLCEGQSYGAIIDGARCTITNNRATGNAAVGVVYGTGLDSVFSGNAGTGNVGGNIQVNSYGSNNGSRGRVTIASSAAETVTAANVETQSTVTITPKNGAAADANAYVSGVGSGDFVIQGNFSGGEIFDYEVNN